MEGRGPRELDVDAAGAVTLRAAGSIQRPPRYSRPTIFPAASLRGARVAGSAVAGHRVACCGTICELARGVRIIERLGIEL